MILLEVNNRIVEETLTVKIKNAQRLVGWKILLLPPRACTNIMTGTNHLLGRAYGGKYSLELKLLHRVLIWDD